MVPTWQSPFRPVGASLGRNWQGKPRGVRLQIFEAGDVVLQSGLTYRGARLAYKTYGTLNAGEVERHRLSDLVRRAALRSRMADRRRASRSTRRKYFIVIIEQVRQRPVVEPEQHAAAVRPRPLSAFHDDRQCPRAAAAARRGVRHRAGEARLRLLDGRRSRRSTGARCSPTGSSASRRSAARPRPRRIISSFSKGSRRR